MVFRSSLKWLVLVAVLPVILAACGGSGSSPESTVEAGFAAMADGDQEALKQCVVPSLRPGMKNDDPQATQMMQAMGKAFVGIKKSEVDGDKAKVWIDLDDDKMVAAMTEMMEEHMKAAGAQQEQMKKMMQAVIMQSAKEMENHPISLVKQDGQWLIDEMK